MAKKKLKPKHVRNKDAKEKRKFLKNNKMKVTAKSICNG